MLQSYLTTELHTAAAVDVIATAAAAVVVAVHTLCTLLPTAMAHMYAGAAAHKRVPDTTATGMLPFFLMQVSCPNDDVARHCIKI